MSFPSDLQIAHQAKLKPLAELAAEVCTMPGLGSSPAAFGMSLDDDGNVVGLS